MTQALHRDTYDAVDIARSAMLLSYDLDAGMRVSAPGLPVRAGGSSMAMSRQAAR